MSHTRDLWALALERRGIVPTTPNKVKRRDREWREQVEIIDRFAATHSRYADVLIHIPNGGSRRNAFEGWRMKRAGVKAGVSDLFLPVPCGPYHGLWIELKSGESPRPRPTLAQRRWLERMRMLGYRAELCVGAEDALNTLDGYLALAHERRRPVQSSARSRHDASPFTTRTPAHRKIAGARGPLPRGSQSTGSASTDRASRSV